MALVAIERYAITIDAATFYFGMYNFAIVGVVSIFGGPFIVPMYINQAYLILTSVIVAWQLSHLQPFLAWVLLVLLALYDLFAVLSPCGPLKALVNLMSREDSPNMPGLLYEASLPTSGGQRRRRRRQNQAEGTGDPQDHVDSQPQVESNAPVSRHASSTVAQHTLQETTSNGNTAMEESTAEASATSTTSLLSTGMPTYSPTEMSPTVQGHAGGEHNLSHEPDPGEESVEVSPLLLGDNAASRELLIEPSRIAQVPFALAKVYKLRFLRDPQPPWIAAVEVHTDEESLTTEITYTPEQLCALVDVVFPRNGGRIVPTLLLETSANEIYRRTAATDETRYTIMDSRGVHKRVVFVTSDGRIFEDLREKNAAEERKERSSIRLGLGDFIFYSILVSKAALYSFTTFAVCTLAILSGLGLTLLLLAVYGAALPALPISIALGVMFYLFTRFVMEPWVEATFTGRVYA
jgi:Presenilin